MEQQPQIVRSEDEASRSRFAKQRMLCSVICCASAKHYAEAIKTNLLPGDRILEIGADALGPVTKGIAAAIGMTGHLVGVKRHGAPNIAVVAVPPDDPPTLPCASYTTTHLPDGLWNVPALQSFGPIAAVVVDLCSLHGNDLLCDSISLIQLLRATYDATLRCIVFRSRALSTHASSFLTDSSFTSFKADDPKGYFARSLAELDSVVCFPPRERKGEGEENEDGIRGRVAAVTGKQCVMSPLVLSAIGVTNYRALIPHVILPHSRCIEIGCADGPTCRLLAAAVPNGKVLGVDVGKECITNARKILPVPPNLAYAVADAWDTSRLLQLEPDADVIFLDMGGLSSVDGIGEALAMCRMLQHTYIRTLRYIVVKSRCLRDHSRALVVQPAVLS